MIDWAQVSDDVLDDAGVTGRAREVAVLSRQGKSLAEITKVLGINRSTAGEHRTKCARAINAAGFTSSGDFRRHVGDGQVIKGKSTMTRNDDGDVVWIKTDRAQEAKQQALVEFAKSLSGDIPRAKPVKLAKGLKHDPDLMSGIFIGDAHVGAYAFGPETRGRDFDTDTATREIRAAVDDLVERSPDAEIGLLVNVGDFLHANGAHATTYSGTPLDVDTRHHRVLRAAGMVLRYCIDRMLLKFEKVVLVSSIGNHDSDSGIALALLLEFYYEKEPRVEVLPTQGFCHYLEYGKWLLGFHHGDKMKPQKLANVMARDLPTAWGRTTHRMWATGHFHHAVELELDGCTIRRFGTLAPQDGWHASQGYGSDSVMEMITFRKSGGTHSRLIHEIPRLVVEPDARL